MVIKEVIFPANIPAPTNVQVKRISPTAMEVTWDPPMFSGIAGYRVYYSMFALAEIDKWSSIEISYTVTEINNLEPHTVYAVQVRAKSIDGRYGNLSEIVFTNRLEQGNSFVVHSNQVIDLGRLFLKIGRLDDLFAKIFRFTPRNVC